MRIIQSSVGSRRTNTLKVFRRRKTGSPFLEGQHAGLEISVGSFIFFDMPPKHQQLVLVAFERIKALHLNLRRNDLV